MPMLFTVRWPLFARLEAVLFFAVTVVLASDITPVRAFVDARMIPTIASVIGHLGLTEAVVFWITMAIAVFVPFLLATIVLDRFLTVRKGYAVLSLLATAAWSGAAVALADHLPENVLSNLAAEIGENDIHDMAVVIAGGAAMLFHLRPFWIGLRDRGGVADRLVMHREKRNSNREQRGRAHHTDDIYHQQTAAFRSWQGRRNVGSLTGSTTESMPVKVLWALTWIGVVAAGGAAYLARSDIAALGQHAGAEPTVSGPITAIPGAVAAPAPTVSTPSVTLPPGGPLPGVRTIGPPPTAAAPSAIPTVQRPSELSASTASAGVTAGQNEAVAERGRDGHFQFDALINGVHVPMLFDTGATVIALRAEDAARLGINMNKLNYSSKAKTANGTADVAPVMIDTITVGNITQHRVPGFVGRPGALHENLLGQAFMARLAGYNVERNQLVLKGR